MPHDTGGSITDADRLLLGLLTAELAGSRELLGKPVSLQKALQRFAVRPAVEHSLAALPDVFRGPGIGSDDWPDDEIIRRSIEWVLFHADPTTPQRSLTTAYEAILRRRRTRRSHGSFYTPLALAAAISREALEAAGSRSCPTVLDPAMGTGTFLLAAVRVLAERIGLSEAAAAERCIWGMDLDPMAVDLAVAGLWLETGARPTVLMERLTVGDALREVLLEPSWDVVVGNPPWGLRPDGARREEMADRFLGSTGRGMDSFELFLGLAARVSRGSIGMIVPSAVLAQESYAGVRAALLARFDPYRAGTIPADAFPDAVAPACALVFGPKPGPALIPCNSFTPAADGVSEPVRGRTPCGCPASPARRRAPTSGATTYERPLDAGAVLVPAGAWHSTTGFPLHSHDILALLYRIQQHHPTLGDLARLYRVRDTGINYNRAAVSARVLYTGPQRDCRDIARYRGRCFSRYTAIQPDGWLRHDAAGCLLPGETLALDWATYGRDEKVVLRQTADRLVATLDRTCMALGRSVIAIVAERPASLPALLACLNSRLLGALYAALAGETGRVLPQVKVGRLLALPLPSVCAEYAEIAPRTTGAATSIADWRLLHELASRCLAASGDLAIEREIDRIVYRLYGLTDAEIALVDREGPLTPQPPLPCAGEGEIWY